MVRVCFLGHKLSYLRGKTWIYIFLIYSAIDAMLRRGDLRKFLGGAPLVYQSRTERLAQAKGRTYYYYYYCYKLRESTFYTNKSTLKLPKHSSGGEIGPHSLETEPPC